MADAACHGRGQWDVMGYMFIVRCWFPNAIIYPETFVGNPDMSDVVYSTKCGVYKPRCGLDNGACTCVVRAGMWLTPVGSDDLMGPQ